MRLTETDVLLKREQLRNAFRPRAPIDEQALFLGRREQLSRALEALLEPGQHMIVYGERGVGKTSFANIIGAQVAKARESMTHVASVTCNSTDDFYSIWKRLFYSVPLSSSAQSNPQQVKMTLGHLVADDLTPADVDILLAENTKQRRFLFIVDEFDQLKDRSQQRLFADTIKALSDGVRPAKIALVGVGESVTELLDGHASVERAIDQIEMPRMSIPELNEIVNTGLSRVGMLMDADAQKQISMMSQGLPHYTHLLASNAAQAALDEASTVITTEHVAVAMKKAIERAEQSIKDLYDRATTSPQRETLFAKVLLACAITPVDPLGRFSAGDIKGGMRKVTGVDYEVSAYNQHLKTLTTERGPVLERSGKDRKYRYRFINPLMRPYVTIKGVSDGLISASDVGL